MHEDWILPLHVLSGEYLIKDTLQLLGKVEVADVRIVFELVVGYSCAQLEEFGKRQLVVLPGLSAFLHNCHP